MKKKVLSAILASSIAIAPVAHADDDAAWAIGGFILGVLVGQDKDDHRSSPPPPPPPEVRRVPAPHREPRLIPQYRTVCEEWQEYDPWGNPRIRRQCHQEFIGYREVY